MVHDMLCRENAYGGTADMVAATPFCFPLLFAFWLHRLEKCIERNFHGLVHSNGSKQSRAIVLNRFGLALIGRIAPDRSEAENVRWTRSTKRLSDNRFTLQECSSNSNRSGPIELPVKWFSK